MSKIMEWSKPLTSAMLLLAQPRSVDPEVNQGIKREISKLIINFVLPLKSASEKAGDYGLNAYGLLRLNPDYMADIARLRYCDSITAQVAKEVVETMWWEWSGRDPLQILNSMGVINSTANSAKEPSLEAILESVLEEQAAAVADYKNGKQAAFGRLMGAAMKLLGKGCDPKEVKAGLERRLS